jgi:hypothetical protein
VANAHRGETSFEVDGKTYRVRFDWNAAAEYEDASGKNIGDALLAIGGETLSAKSLRAMLWAGLQEYHRAEFPDVKSAGVLVGKMGRQTAVRVLWVALHYFYPDVVLDPDASPPADPPQPPPST